MRLKTFLPAALAGLVLGVLATPAIVKATTDNDLARRSWIHTLNTELKDFHAALGELSKGEKSALALKDKVARPTAAAE